MAPQSMEGNFALPRNSSMADSKKGVQFCDQHNSIREVPSISDMSEKEIESTWLTRDDMASMAEKVKSEIFELSMSRRWRSGSSSSLSSCSEDDEEEVESQDDRGLEWKTWEGAQQRTKNTNQARTVVLAEQERQRRETGELADVDRMAEQYKQATGVALVSALRLAKRDRLAAEKVAEDAEKSQRVYESLEQEDDGDLDYFFVQSHSPFSNRRRAFALSARC